MANPEELSTEFDLLQVGYPGRIEVVPKIRRKDETILPHATLICGLPPVLPTVEDDLEALLKHPENLPIHDYRRCQRFLPRKPQPPNLYHLDTTPIQTELVVDRNPTTGELMGFSEELISGIGDTCKNSTSLSRAPGCLADGIRGSTTNFPFWPGGLEEPDLPALRGEEGAGAGVDLEHQLLSTAPGLAQGINFPQKSLSEILDTAARQATVNLADILTAGDEIDLGEDEEVEEKGDDKPDVAGTAAKAATKENIDDIIKLDSRLETDLSYTPSDKDGEEWAVVLDTSKPVKDFHKRIPDPAYSWPFELDVFQKQAVLRLEQHENVFVAAHTSAGKTVVAEYAIALSMKHMTRSIYTSPIKALSNQKFRDFKQTFGDVGLITGDVQLKQEASCLIMTTEILRSMLYNGSDVIRDLEWVIFDEVHYINDAERGVVWEEVLIMLPQHVNIILLSATVPNTREFATWIGRTKRKKVYVVSTTKRPVPLEHFLYTGNSAKTSSELFLLMDAGKNFLQTGYNKAVEAKKERASKASQSYGAKGTRSGGGGSSQDKNVWLSLIEMLRKKDKLPVVAFTFSKKRIDDNANLLTSVDLTTQSEKSEIHVFFQRCIARLKGEDKKLPQVTHMCDILKRGIGVHHSGVLPILKETVEMLFGKGLVKILFATETFAMGVNMPARTVVFDTTRKHDGTNFRDLLPGEYIQMAGRAGRRGLDTTGTVILLAKGDVPEMSDLHKMMLGKPTLLQSQFRLTYSMILNLLRVEQLRIEDMMKRSFSEFHNQKDSTENKANLDEVTKQLSDLPQVYDYSGDLEEYYSACDEYHRLQGELHKVIMTHPAAMKALSPGRLVIIDMTSHRHSLGVVLQAGQASSKERTFTALVTCEQGQGSKQTAPESSMDKVVLPTPVRASQLFRPEGPCGHKLVTLKTKDIKVICTKTIKISADKIIDDVKKRQMPRFRSDPPSQSVSLATQELMRIVEANPTGLPGLDPMKDLHMRDMDMVEDCQRLQMLESSFEKYQCVNEPSFEENFAQLRSNRKLQERYEHLRFLLSDQSLVLLPEYNQRIDVLRKLNYIDESNTVQLKGRVACEISNHELIITELVFENVLTALHPTEIASILSAVVFEMKKCPEPSLQDTLVEARANFIKVAEKIGKLQKECGLKIPVDDYIEEFKFGLAEVVFEWARGMPFNDITNLTDIQEGIIVRCIQRLDETLRDVRNAARIIGDPILYQKMEEASRMIKRDIVFAASLYTQ